MIRSVNSDFPNFEPIVLKNGVNIILAQRINNTTNGVGKSLFLESIDYVLGADYTKSELAKYPELQGYSITLIMDFEGEIVEVSRMISNTSRENNFISMVGKPSVPMSQWKQRLKIHYFGVDMGPSFFSWRSLLHFFFKKESINKFETGLKSFSGDPEYKTSAYQSFLLNIAYEEIKELSQTAMLKSEKAGFTKYINSLKKTVELMPEIIPDDVDTYTEVNQELSKQINEIKFEVTTLQNEIDLLSVQEGQLLNSYREIEVSEANTSHFGSLYHILDVELSEFVKKTFEESKDFNKILLQENFGVVRKELRVVQWKLNQLLEKQIAAKNQLKSILDTKKYQKDSINKIDMSSVLLRGLLQTPSSTISSKVDVGISELTEDNPKKINKIIEENQQELDRYENQFESIVNYVYEANRDVHFSVNFIDSLKIDFHYEDDSGTGKGNMKLIIYYFLLLKTNNVLLNRNIDFMFLDTDITDGIDANNIYRFLELADTELKEFNGQIIMTMKDDRDISVDTAADNDWIRMKLFDGPGGYLFKEKLSKKRNKK